jgi:hypothetical protein
LFAISLSFFPAVAHAAARVSRFHNAIHIFHIQIKMLTPNDIHLIIGILCKQTNPENVDVILGDMIYDIAAEKKRDIDVTISYKNIEGEQISFVGIEVKDHTRKLDTIQVEQLCIKFKDMPSIKKGGIVSASGYTRDAIKKAKYHSIDLYEFKDWDGLFHNLSFDKNYIQTEVKLSYKGQPQIDYIIDVTEAEKAAFTINSMVFDSSGNSINHIKDIADLNRRFTNHLLNDLEIKEESSKLLDGQSFSFIRVIDILDTPNVSLLNRMVKIPKVRIRGTIECNFINSKPEFKVLVKKDDYSIGQVGCVISEMSNGVLMGMTISTENQNLKLIVIPLPDRLRDKIRNIRIN